MPRDMPEERRPKLNRALGHFSFIQVPLKTPPAAKIIELMKIN